MFMEIIKQRIDDYNDLRNKYYNTELCSEELSSAMNTMVVIIGILILFYIILFILSIYYAFKCSMTLKWPIMYPLLLITLSLVPYYGGIITIGLVIFGMLNCGSLCSMPNDIVKRG